MNLGIPDCIVALYGTFHLVELKVAKENGKVDISPHQVAFHLAHRDYPTWVFVQSGKGKKARLSIYRGREVKTLQALGVDWEPSYAAEYPWDWMEVEDHLTLCKK